ncbi:Mur ligase family protein [Mesorhizobium sp. M0938]|uniref:Mur ligase family protein n=1 Tax=unclassified Mesorhizobium TaxID=325217 RepID=UPI00333B52EC
MNAGLRKVREDLRQRFDVYRAKRARSKSNATFIGITGSSGKSTVTALLGHILEGHGAVRTQILFHSLKMLSKMLCRQIGGVDYVVVETSASGIDSIKPMADLLRPDVAVVTMVRLEHFKAFRTLENVAREKRALVDALQLGGFAILNADDPHVVEMASATTHRAVTFGMSEQADYRVTNVHAAYPHRLTLAIHWRGGELELKTPFPGEHFWLPTAAAASAALELGVPPEKVAARVATFRPLANRCEMLVTEGGPQFIVDAAKSPWHSVDLAFEMMAKATTKPKRIVLGQISDYAGSTRKYHYAYKTAREIAAQVIYVGDNAHRSGAGQEDRDAGRFHELRMPKEVSDHIKRTAVAGELILLKSSSRLHLERIALAWKHDVKCWIPICGKREGCDTCGLFEVPFEGHRDYVRKRRHDKRWRRFRRLLGGRS